MTTVPAYVQHALVTLRGSLFTKLMLASSYAMSALLLLLLGLHQ